SRAPAEQGSASPAARFSSNWAPPFAGANRIRFYGSVLSRVLRHPGFGTVTARPWLRLGVRGLRAVTPSVRVKAPRTDRLLALLLLAVVPLAGCGGNQNTVHPESPQERAITTLWWVMLAGAAIGFGIILVLLTFGWLRRNRENLPFGIGERGGARMVVGLGVATPVVLLTALF